MATNENCRVFFKACCDVILKKKNSIHVFVSSADAAKVTMVLLSDSLLIYKPSYDL